MGVAADEKANMLFAHRLNGILSLDYGGVAWSYVMESEVFQVRQTISYPNHYRLRF